MDGAVARATMVGWDFMALFWSIVTLKFIFLRAVIAKREIAVELKGKNENKNMGEGDRENETYFEVLLSTTIAPWNSTVSWSRKGGILAFPSVCPGAVIACGKHPIAL